MFILILALRDEIKICLLAHPHRDFQPIPSIPLIAQKHLCRYISEMENHLEILAERTFAEKDKDEVSSVEGGMSDVG